MYLHTYIFAHIHNSEYTDYIMYVCEFSVNTELL